MPMTREDLDRLGCAIPGCDCESSVVYFHCKDHPGAKIEVSYRAENGVVRVGCMICKRAIISLAIQEKPS